MENKGCNYCLNGKVTDIADIDKDSQIKWWIYKDNLQIVANIQGNTYEVREKIKICFNCGRELNVKSKNKYLKEYNFEVGV